MITTPESCVYYTTTVRNTIELPIGNNVVPLRSDNIRLVQNGCSFHGLRSEDPNQHLKDFLKLVDSLDLDDENRERMRLHLFQFSLRDQASNWLERLPAGSITTWEDLTTRFLAQFFPPGRIVKLRNDILIKDSDTEEDVSKTNARRCDLGKMARGNEEVKEQGKEEDEMETNVEVKEVIEEEEIKFETDEEVEEILEEEEDDENFNSFLTMKELSHHEWLLNNPRPPWIPLALLIAALERWYLGGLSLIKSDSSTTKKKERLYFDLEKLEILRKFWMILG
ncbi:zinc finger, CCHC-type containing protein [Tanacetum coccineum]